MTVCIGRISKVQGILHFAEGRHRFYLEYRCSNNVIANTNKCIRCTGRTTDKIQSSGKYDHGNVNEPIPNHSQMYGGKWYIDGCAKWGNPSDIDIKTAEEHRDAARAQFVEHNIVVNNLTTTIQPRKRTIKHNITDIPILNSNITDIAIPNTVIIDVPIIPIPIPAVQPRKRVVKTKPLPKPLPQIESIIATHIEKEIEEFGIDDYEVEYVKLTPFEHNDISYFREPVKNKLFERKTKTIGAYIGRYDSYTDTIRTDIPDSDSED